MAQLGGVKRCRFFMFFSWELICHEEIMAREPLFSNTILPQQKPYWNANASPGRHSGRREKADLLRKRQRCNSLWKMWGSLVWEHSANRPRQLVVDGRILPAFLICVPLCVHDMWKRNMLQMGTFFFSILNLRSQRKYWLTATWLQYREVRFQKCKCFFQGNASFDVFQALRHRNGIWLNPRNSLNSLYTMIVILYVARESCHLFSKIVWIRDRSSCIPAIAVAMAGVDLKTASEYWTQSTNMSSLDPRGELIRNKAAEEAKT